MKRRQTLKVLASAVPPLSLGGWASAQPDYPAKPVRLLVGVAPGGAADVFARLYAQKVGEALQRSFVVENRAGAGGTLAADVVAKAAADGYTLLVSAPTVMVVAPYLYKKLPFDPTRDFEPVALLSGGPLVLVVHASVPANNVAELLALAKGKPGQLAFGSGGQGTASHLTAEMFASATGIQLLHSPYKGDGQAVTDLVGGQVQMMFTALSLVDPQIKAGRLKLLAVTSKIRLPSIPQVPTVDESGVQGFESLGWIGLFAPAKTPAAIVQKLALAWNKVRQQPDVEAHFSAMGMGLLRFNSPQEFANFQRSEVGRWSQVIKAAGVQPE